MVELIKLAAWSNKPKGHVIFIHGLGGHAYNSWRSDETIDKLWPLWIARDIPGLTVWTISFPAPPTGWLGNAMPLQDRAANLLELLVSEEELTKAPLSFVCHSLGGLVFKQIVRTAENQRGSRPEADGFLRRLKSVIFMATPHTGSAHATLMDRLRLVAWPSTATAALLKNDAHLRELNSWYRNWSQNKIAHKIFYETRETLAGMIVDQGSADAGLSGVTLVPIDAQHKDICKPVSDKALVYTATKSFLAKHALVGPPRRKATSELTTFPLRPVVRARPNLTKPIAFRALMLGLLGVFFWFFWSDAVARVETARIDRAIAEAEENLRTKQPNLAEGQIQQFVTALRRLHGTPGFEAALSEAKKGNTDAVRKVWLTIFEKGREEAAAAARGIATIWQMNNLSSGETLKWYRVATELRPENPDGWLGLGNAARVAQKKEFVVCPLTGLGSRRVPEAECALRRYLDLVQKAGEVDPRDKISGLFALGDYQMAETQFAGARNSYQLANNAALRLDTSQSGRIAAVRIQARSFRKLGGAYAALGQLDEAEQAYRSAVELIGAIGKSDDDPNRANIDQARLFTKQAEVFLERCKFEDAQKALESARDLQRKVGEVQARRIAHRVELAWTLGKLGEAYWRDNRLKEARTAFADAEALARPLADANTSNAERQNALWLAYFNLARVEIDDQNYSEALRNLQAAEQISGRLLKIDRTNDAYRRELAVIYKMQGLVRESLRSQEASEGARAKAQEILDSLNERGARLPGEELACEKG